VAAIKAAQLGMKTVSFLLFLFLFSFPCPWTCRAVRTGHGLEPGSILPFVLYPERRFSRGMVGIIV
jgi:hypothetical protein